MPRFDFKPLFDDYANVIAQMPFNFTSHDFILRLAQRNQQAFIEALHHHRKEKEPFLMVHGILAKQLELHQDLIHNTGVVDGVDIFGHKSRCVRWAKV
jgi:hypothetical protein